jgi:hypothetical protein
MNPRKSILMDMSIPTDMERSTGMERSMGINTIMQRKSQLLMCTVTDTDMLAIRMDTRKHMTMVIVMVGMLIITVMQKKSQLLMFIVTDMVTHMDMVIHTAVVIPTVTIMVGTRMGILTVTLTTALK